MDCQPQSLPYLSYPFSYQDFLLNHLLPNTPCLFSRQLTSSWPCFSSFLLPHSPRSINAPHLLALQGSSNLVSVHRPSTPLEREEGEAATVCEERRLEEVLGLWEDGKKEGKGLYVKDWHLALQNEREGEKEFYETPGVFRDDWLNGWCRTKGLEDDFKFVYLGSPNTTTHLHRDVYSSNSFSTNLLGRKRWTLFPPSHSHLLRRFPDLPRSQLISDVREVDKSVFRGWEEARKKAVVVIQEEGETIFVPGGWYHQVENLPSSSSPTQPILSINHNWLNSTSLLRVFQALVDDIEACEESIEDVREMLVVQYERERVGGRSEAKGGEENVRAGEAGLEKWEAEWVREVQELVKMDSGWGWEEFWGCVEWGVENSLDPSVQDLQPPLSYIRDQVNLVLESYEGRRDAMVLRSTSMGSTVGETVKRKT
ncbi:hypothetical protein BDY24DRAFT_418319 [Mrakia frigida]|uniref:uncharacterized protein n=1 Tax=Mrakia frigida TaxID=29902 RepID=UPI003FCC0163